MIERLEQLLHAECSSHILPFLWMKGEDTLTIREEIDKIEECGIKEICLESRPYPDFCGPRWWETMDFLVPEAEKSCGSWMIESFRQAMQMVVLSEIRNMKKYILQSAIWTSWDRVRTELFW